MPALFNINGKNGSSLMMALLVIFVSATSCSEDNLVNELQVQERMSFDVSVSSNWNSMKSRATERERTVTSEKIENSDLWLVTIAGNNSDTTCFDAARGLTRANPYDPTDGDGNNDNQLTNFGVYAWTYTGDWNTTTDKKLYIRGDEVSPKGDDLWSTAPLRYWPGDAYTMKFFAFAPYTFGNGNTMTINENNGTPVISYTTDTDARKQQDLLATTSMDDVSGGYKQPLPLTFKHLLTAINVRANGDIGRTIKSVRFSGIMKSGTYTHGQTETVWTVSGEEATISCNDLTKPLSEGYTDIITDDESTTFMMVPQVLGENAKIEVTLLESDGTTETTLSAPLTGNVWQIGQRIIYTLSLTSETIIPTISFEYDMIEYDFKGATYAYNGGLQTYIRSSRYQSYVTIIDGNGNEKPEPRAWTSRFVEKKGGGYVGIEKPDWITTKVHYSGKGNIGYNEQDRYTLNVKHAEIRPNVHNLRFKTPVVDYDLSTRGEAGTENMNTANCYIVNAPGTYKFPLVYGNAIKGGEYNENAFRAALSEMRALRVFLNHDDMEIDNPWIAKNLNADSTTIVPHDAIRLWEDTENGLISRVWLTGESAEEYRVNFEITEEDIKQGNAIIAVRDAKGTILWSWHIWVTDYEAMSGPEITAEYDNLITQTDKLVQTADGDKTYTFMGVPLGWCDGDSYEENKTMLELTQEGTGAKAYLTIRQRPSFLSGNAPYYQWGRKDPMLPFSGNVDNENAREKKYTMCDGYALGDMGRRATIGEAIRQPHTFIQYAKEIETDWYQYTIDNTDNSEVPIERRLLNLWNIEMRYDAYGMPFKTVYDPSPFGYVVPPTEAMSAITYEGQELGYNQWNWSLINSPYTNKNEAKSNHGWIFYCNRMPAQGTYDASGGVIYVPVLGQREYDLGNYVKETDGTEVPISGIGTSSAVYWACEAGANKTVSNNMKITTEKGLIPQSSDISGHAMPVRPVREHMPINPITGN